jgi:tetratricopeptide (TPR) repeat protein
MTELNLIGTTVGRFEILSELGRGGMAVVYRARQTDLDRIVALKVLPPSLTHDSGYVARFRQEAKSAARLEHPHIMPIYEVGEAGGLHYIAMKFIEGRTVKELLQAEGALSVSRAAMLLAQVGDALDYAHRQNVIHRDIKPSNMMVTGEGWVFLTDFGLARGTAGDSAGLTMAGTVMGTPEYMSPEQAQGLPNVGPPTDIYALGVVLYELLTGGFPFKADTPMGMLAARLLQAPTPPRDIRGDLPIAVEDVVMRALARKPEARYHSAAQMVAALRAAAGIGTSEPQRPATPLGGSPAIGATIKVPALAPPPTPPYVRPAAQPAVAAPSAAPPPQPALTLPAAAAAPPVKARNGVKTVLIIAAVLALVMVVGCVSLVMLVSPSASDPQNVRTAVAEGNFTAALGNGDNSLENGDVEEALGYYEEALGLKPGHPDAVEKLALAYNARADYARGEEYANQLIDAAASSDAQVALGYALLADSYLSRGDPVAAAAEAEKAVAADPQQPLAQAIHSNVLAARALAVKNSAEMDQALDALGLAEDNLAGAPPLVEALTHSALGFTFAQEYLLSGGENYLAQSERSYQQAVELFPDLPLFHANLAALRSAAGDYEAARDGYAEALDADPSFAPAQSGIGWSYYQEGESERAAEAFDAAIALDGALFDGYYGKGRLAFDAADTPEAYAEAAKILRQAADLNPRSAEARAYLGEALLFQGFQGEAGPDQEAAYADAEQAYREALAHDDRSAFAQAGLGWIFQYQERYEDSVEAFTAALALDGANEESHNGLAWSLYNLARYDEAEQSFRAAIERDTDDSYASARYGLGRTLEQLRRTDEARAAYEEALAINPDYQDAREALDALGS